MTVYGFRGVQIYLTLMRGNTMNSFKPFTKSLTAIASAIISLVAVNSPAVANPTYVPKVVNYTTALPTQQTPYLMPYGYTDTARTIPQVVMAGISPSVIDSNDTSFDILALVRPGTSALQKVSVGQGQGSNPFFNFSLKHINTLKNGDQFWKITYTFEKGAFGTGVIPIKWGSAVDEFFVQASDSAQGFNGHPFPSIKSGSFPAVTPYLDVTKDDKLAYNTTKRIMPQVISAGVSPAIVDIRDTSFDVVAMVRPGAIPLQNVTLKQVSNNVFSIPLEKKKQFSNGDEIWVANIPFPAGAYGISTVPVVWGIAPGQFNIQVMDVAQQSSTAYPVLRAGTFTLQP